MKKVILITLTIITIFSLISCDYRRQISKEKCNEIYNHIRDSFIFNNVDDYLYYDYSYDLLIISNGEQLYCNKEPGFFLNYDYNKYIIDMQVIINNYVPLDIIGYRINSQVEYMLNVTYDYKLIEEEINFKINNCNFSLYENSNVGIEIQFYNSDSIGIIVGKIELLKYERYNLKELFLE